MCTHKNTFRLDILQIHAEKLYYPQVIWCVIAYALHRQ